MNEKEIRRILTELKANGASEDEISRVSKRLWSMMMTTEESTPELIHSPVENNAELKHSSVDTNAGFGESLKGSAEAVTNYDMPGAVSGLVAAYWSNRADHLEETYGDGLYESNELDSISRDEGFKKFAKSSGFIVDKDEFEPRSIRDLFGGYVNGVSKEGKRRNDGLIDASDTERRRLISEWNPSILKDKISNLKENAGRFAKIAENFGLTPLLSLIG